jgi:hypothetical protein
MRFKVKKLASGGFMVWDRDEQECVKKFGIYDEPLAQSFARLMNYCYEMEIRCSVN